MRKYLLPDCLKPEYDGMSSYELAGKIIEAADWAAREEQQPEHPAVNGEDEDERGNPRTI